jgi:hypothetical protein
VQGLNNPLARRPELVISTFGLAEIISCMPVRLAKKNIGYWQTCQYSRSYLYSHMLVSQTLFGDFLFLLRFFFFLLLLFFSFLSLWRVHGRSQELLWPFWKWPKFWKFWRRILAPLMVTYHYVKFYVSIIIQLEVININVQNFKLQIILLTVTYSNLIYTLTVYQ